MQEHTHTQTVAITKNPKGWSVHTIQQWAESSPHCHTHSGKHSLKYAIHFVVDWAWKNATQITSLTVNGKPYPREKIKTALNKYTTYGASTEDLLKHVILNRGTTTMRIGDKVTVYQKPYTKKKPEGTATLLKHLYDDYWDVVFDDDDEPQKVYARTIVP